MKLSTITQVGRLGLAAWLAVASGLLGCAYAIKAEEPAAGDACHQGMPVAPEPAQPGGHDCCNLPAGEEPDQSPEQGQFDECCFQMALATVGKSKPPDVRLVESERLLAGTTLAAVVDLGAGVDTLVPDAIEAYLLFGVLRI